MDSLYASIVLLTGAIERIKQFLSTYTTQGKDLVDGIADIDLQDDAPQRSKNVKYTQQLVCPNDHRRSLQSLTKLTAKSGEPRTGAAGHRSGGYIRGAPYDFSTCRFFLIRIHSMNALWASWYQESAEMRGAMYPCSAKSSTRSCPNQPKISANMMRRLMSCYFSGRTRTRDLMPDSNNSLIICFGDSM